MLIYITCFAVSCAFARSDEYYRKKNKRIAAIFAMLAIIVPCFIAGARDVGVGTDTKVYAEPLFRTALYNKNGLKALLSSPYGEDIEAFTIVMYYIISRFTDNIFWAFFCTELVCIVPVYFAIRESDVKPGQKWLALLGYYCLFYCYSLNIMRQMMALSIIFYCFRFLKKEKTFIYFLCTLVLTVLVHKTAILGLLVWLLYATCTKNKISLFKIETLINKKTFFTKVKTRLYANKSILLPMYIGGSFIIILASRSIIMLFSRFKESFSYQLNNMNSSFNLSLAPLILMMLYVFPIIFSYNKLVKKNTLYRFFFFVSIISIILWQLQGISGETYRIVLYYWIYIIMFIPYYIQSFKHFSNRVLSTLYYVAILFGNCIYYFMICGSGEVIPYTSKMLGI